MAPYVRRDPAEDGRKKEKKWTAGRFIKRDSRRWRRKKERKKGGEAAEAVEESSGAEAVWTTTNEGDERAGRRTCPLDHLVHFSTGRRMKVDATQ